MSRPRFVVLALIILAAAASRLIPHPPNVASIAAVALFGGAYLTNKRLALIVPLAALLLSDLVLGFYRHMEVVYGAFLLVVCLDTHRLAGLPTGFLDLSGVGRSRLYFQ